MYLCIYGSCGREKGWLLRSTLDIARLGYTVRQLQPLDCVRAFRWWTSVLKCIQSSGQGKRGNKMLPARNPIMVRWFWLVLVLVIIMCFVGESFRCERFNRFSGLVRHQQLLPSYLLQRPHLPHHLTQHRGIQTFFRLSIKKQEDPEDVELRNEFGIEEGGLVDILGLSKDRIADLVQHDDEFRSVVTNIFSRLNTETDLIDNSRATSTRKVKKAVSASTTTTTTAHRRAADPKPPIQSGASTSSFERIQKVISRAGVASRREAETMVCLQR
jgi:hypothetical protein